MKLTIRAIQTSKHASWFYRMQVPFAALRRAGHKVQIVGNTLPFEEGKRFPAWLLRDADVLVLQRASIWENEETGQKADIVSAIEHARRYVAVVQDNDDYLAAIRPSNPASEQWNEERIRVHERTLDACTMLTWSTPRLAEVHRDRRRLQEVLPNYLPEFVDKLPEKASVFSVLLTGSLSHGEDWLVILDRLASWFERHPDARLVTIGFVPDTLPDEHRELGEVRKIIERVPRVSSYDWLPIERYLRVMVRMHVLVAPLAQNEFNECKSAIKAKEAAMTRVYSLLSPVGEYRDWLAQYRDWGITAPIGDDFEDRLDDLYGRHRTGELSLLWPRMTDAAMEHVITRHVEKWESAYRKAVIAR